MSLYYFKVYGLLLEYWLSKSRFVDFFNICSDKELFIFCMTVHWQHRPRFRQIPMIKITKIDQIESYHIYTGLKKYVDHMLANPQKGGTQIMPILRRGPPRLCQFSEGVPIFWQSKTPNHLPPVMFSDQSLSIELTWRWSWWWILWCYSYSIITSHLTTKMHLQLKDVSLPDIKVFSFVANNIISVNLWWLAFKTMVRLTQYIHHVWIQTTFFVPLTPIHFQTPWMKHYLSCVVTSQ